MTSGLLVRLRPAGPWRYGSPAGERRESDLLYRSDSLYSALTLAMASLGELEPWLDTTARAAEPQIRFSSCFPWMNDTLYVTPPRNIWPMATPKLRTKGARFVPTKLVSDLLSGKVFDENKWRVDAQSGCLLPATRKPTPSPFRSALRTGAAVDRLTGGQVAPHVIACVEFSANAGLWTFVAFASEEARTQWEGPVKAAFRLLADSGFGGRRSIGWGRAEQPTFRSISLEEIIEIAPAGEPTPEPPVTPVPEEPATIEPAVEPAASELTEPTPPTDGLTPAAETVPAEIASADEAAQPPLSTEPPPAPKKPVYWLLSLFCPTTEEASQLAIGSYAIVTRGGRVEAPSHSGELKKQLRMISEGSVVAGGQAPNGHAPNVAPDGFPHPVYRYGFALSLPIPAGVNS